MKNIISLFIAVVLAMQLPAKTIEKTYFFNDFQTKQMGAYHMILAPGSFQTAISGQPLLPWYASKILLPPGEEIASVEIIGLDPVKIPGSYQLMPKQYAQPISKGASGEFIKDEKLYKSSEVYPQNIHQHFQTSFLGGHSIGMINYTPFEYIPANGELSFYRQITVVVHTEKSTKAKDALSLTSQSSVSQIASFVENPEVLKTYNYPSQKSDNYDYLIITPNQFIEDFDTLIAHYLLRGMKTMVKSKEEILDEMSGQDAPEKIRNYIIQEYTDKGISYVLLGGDVEHIPYRGFYCTVQSSSVYEDDNIPSDLYYSALDGSWNDDNDGKWGEIGEDDLLPEVAVARFSFSNASELSNMLHKTISYQSYPVLEDLAHPLFAGEHLYDNPTTWGSDYLELLVGYHDDNGYETTGIPEESNITKLYDVNSNWSASDLMNEINMGKNFVHHVGHANESTVMKFYTSDINNNNFSGANGVDHQYTNVYTHGCICGSFDASDCIAEHMVKINNFAAAFVGNSRYGWFNEGQTEGPSQHIHREFMDALYTDRLHRIGMAHMESKFATSPWVNAPGQHEEGALRWCFYDCNVLGDAAMSVWTKHQQDINVDYNPVITIGQSTYNVVTLTISGDNPYNVNAALIMDGELYGTGICNSGGLIDFEIDPVFTNVGTATLSITGYNCLPQEFEIQIIPAEGAYVVLEECAINDVAGNNNGLLDYGENVWINLSSENVGQEIAEGVTAELSCESEYVTILEGTASIGNIAGNESVSIDAAFNFELSSSIPDMTVLPFEITFTSGDDVWVSQMQLPVYAPLLQLTEFHVNDAAGNNNGRLDPGETIEFFIGFANNGHSLSPAIATQLTTDSDFITVNNSNQNSDALNPDENFSLGFEIVVDESAQIGDIAHLMMNLQGGAYNDFMSYYLPVGLLVEDWETGSFDEYSWYSGGNAPWMMTDSETYEGDYSVQSGSINDSQESEMIIDLNVVSNDSISFYYKVSSEESFDYLRFYIDENEQEKWSGEVDWSRAAFTINAGEHSFNWSYTKDGYMSNGEDKAYVDYIVFPAMGIISGIDQLEAFRKVEIFPNPVTDLLQIELWNDCSQFVSIQIIDQKGNTVYQDNTQLMEGNQQISLSFQDYAAGVYTIVLAGERQISNIKFVKL